MLLFLKLGHGSLQVSKQQFFFFFFFGHGILLTKFFGKRNLTKAFLVFYPSFPTSISMAKSTYKIFTFQVGLPL